MAKGCVRGREGLQNKGIPFLEFLVNSQCSPTPKFIITRTRTTVEPYVYTVERFGTSGATITCMGQHQLRGFLHGVGVEASKIGQAVQELELSDRTEVEATEAWA